LDPFFTTLPHSDLVWLHADATVKAKRRKSETDLSF